MKLSDSIEIFLKTFKRSRFSGLKNLMQALLDLQREPIKISSYPLMVQIEPTVYCNLSCIMCVHPLRSRKQKHMSLEEFKKIIDAMPFLKKLSLVGAGEPLLNPEFFDMIAYAKSQDILVGFATNGLLLNPVNCAKIIDARIDWLNISLDSSQKNGYESIRGNGADFEKVTANIKNLMEIVKNRKPPDISLWFVIMKDNLKELPAIVKLARKLGIRDVWAQLQHCWGSSDIRDKFGEWPTVKDYASIKSILIEAKQTAIRERARFNYVNVPDTLQARRCQWPWKSCHITVEGFITPCCLQGADPERINFGNIFKKDFAEIWNNQRYQDFRRLLKSKELPSICKDCPGYYRRIKI